MSNTVFPGRNVISWYESVEALLDDVLTVIPFEPSHLTVWSPKLTTVLLETCSQLDSLWKHEALLLPDVTGRRLTIKDYFKSLVGTLHPDGWSSGVTSPNSYLPSNRGKVRRCSTRPSMTRVLLHGGRLTTVLSTAVSNRGGTHSLGTQ